MPHSLLIQFGLLIVTSLLFAAAFLLGLQHMRKIAPATPGASDAAAGLAHEASMGPLARAAVALAMAVGITLLVWRALAERTLALPVSNPFDAFLLLALLLALTVIYFRWTRHLRSFSFFLLPMIVILLIFGLVLALVHPAGDRPDYRNVWTLLHVITINAATVCFTLGCVGGVVYLLADRQLRRKGLDSTHRWIGLPPLASIEKFVQWMVYCGFPMLVISIVAGIIRIAESHTSDAPAVAQTQDASRTIKVAFGILALFVYAILLHVPLNPRFRGPRAAWLAILGFLLFIGAFAAAKWS